MSQMDLMDAIKPLSDLADELERRQPLSPSLERAIDHLARARRQLGMPPRDLRREMGIVDPKPRAGGGERHPDEAPP